MKTNYKKYSDFNNFTKKRHDAIDQAKPDNLCEENITLNDNLFDDHLCMKGIKVLEYSSESDSSDTEEMDNEIENNFQLYSVP